MPSFALHARPNNILEKGCQREIFEQEQLRLQRLQEPQRSLTGARRALQRGEQSSSQKELLCDSMLAASQALQRQTNGFLT